MEKTGATARLEGAPGRASALVAAAVALVAGAGAVRWVGSGEPVLVSAGVLSGVVALAAAAVLLGGVPYGPEVEGRLGLSTRLALGLLGGVLGAVVSAAAEWAVGATGLAGALHVEIGGPLTAEALALHLAAGGVWGLVLGVVFPAVPGGSAVARGAGFSLVPALWVLFKVFPIDRQVGILGYELGVLAFVFVLLFWLLWGVTAGRVFAWGARTPTGPLDRPLGS